MQGFDPFEMFIMRYGSVQLNGFMQGPLEVATVATNKASANPALGVWLVFEGEIDRGPPLDLMAVRAVMSCIPER